jgi:hypothetical protein
MSSFKDALETAILNHICRATPYSHPATCYLALYTVAPTDSTPGTEVSDSGTNYSRQPISWNPASGRSINNSADIVFSCVGSAFGTIVAAAVCSGSVVGVDDQMAWDGVDSKPIAAGETYTVKATTGLVISIDASGAVGGLKTTAVTAMLDFIFRNVDWAGTGSAAPYVALYTVTPSDSAAGTEVSTSGTGYARQQVAFDAPTGDPQYCDNTAQKDYPATTAFGTVVAQAVCKADVEGVDDIIYWGDLTEGDAIIGDGDTLRFGAGAIKVYLT